MVFEGSAGFSHGIKVCGSFINGRPQTVLRAYRDVLLEQILLLPFASSFVGFITGFIIALASNRTDVEIQRG